MATITLIAAIGDNNCLGKDNKLLWHIPEDLKFFKEHTIGKQIILGRKTLESLPGLLPKRKHLVLTHQDLPENENLIVFHNIEDLLKYINNLDEEVMVIGGAKIYKEFLPYCKYLYLTLVDLEKEADTFFPEFDKTLYDAEIIKKCTEDGADFTFMKYTKRL